MIRLRAATAEDCEAVWRFNNDPDARAQSLSTAPIPWETHQRWFASAMVFVSMIEVDGVVAGVVRVRDGLVSIAIDVGQRGRGVGTAALRLLEGPLDAWIAADNVASQRAFEKAGFSRKEDVQHEGRTFTVWSRGPST